MLLTPIAVIMFRLPFLAIYWKHISTRTSNVEVSVPEVLPFKAASEAEVRVIALWLISGSENTFPEGVEDDTYLRTVKRQLNLGTLQATLVKQIWEYAFGRAMGSADQATQDNPLAALSHAELAAESQESIDRLNRNMEKLGAMKAAADPEGSGA